MVYEYIWSIYDIPSRIVEHFNMKLHLDDNCI